MADTYVNADTEISSPQQSALAALANSLTVDEIAKLGTLAKMFVVGDESGVLSSSELSENLARFDSQRAELPDQRAPTAAEFTGFIWKDKLGVPHAIMLCGKETGLTVMSRLNLAGHTGIWARAARFGDNGYGGHMQVFYDAVNMPAFEAMPGYVDGRQALDKPAVLRITSDLDESVWPGSFAPLLLLEGNGGSLIGAKHQISGDTLYRVSNVGQVTPLPPQLVPSVDTSITASGGPLSVLDCPVEELGVDETAHIVITGNSQTQPIILGLRLNGAAAGVLAAYSVTKDGVTPQTTPYLGVMTQGRPQRIEIDIGPSTGGEPWAREVRVTFSAGDYTQYHGTAQLLVGSVLITSIGISGHIANEIKDGTKIEVTGGSLFPWK